MGVRCAVGFVDFGMHRRARALHFAQCTQHQFRWTKGLWSWCHVACVLYHFAVGRLERRSIRQYGKCMRLSRLISSWTMECRCSDGSDDSKNKNPNELNNLIRKIGLVIVRDFLYNNSEIIGLVHARRWKISIALRCCVTIERSEYNCIVWSTLETKQLAENLLSAISEPSEGQQSRQSIETEPETASKQKSHNVNECSIPKKSPETSSQQYYAIKRRIHCNKTIS